MYLHLGCEALVRSSEIVGLFDLDTTTVSGVSRAFLHAAQERGEIRPLGNELPKSFVLAEKGGATRVFLSPLAVATLLKRTETELY
ncbi:MAG: DUF370 domain-containing protein [Oscillospiraceae bacterium]|jgi:hypothetical protein|nr:DUF370 domain-containing protein [Oscillospiraceae bacterium]